MSADLQHTRAELLKAGEARRFPTFWFSESEGIGPGREAWERFTGHASAEKLTAAAAALKRKPRPTA